MKNNALWVQHNFRKLANKALEQEHSKFAIWLCDNSSSWHKGNNQVRLNGYDRILTLGEAYQVFLLRQT